MDSHLGLFFFQIEVLLNCAACVRMCVCVCVCVYVFACVCVCVCMCVCGRHESDRLVIESNISLGIYQVTYVYQKYEQGACIPY